MINQNEDVKHFIPQVTPEENNSSFNENCLNKS
jgi:hypothetical protein